MKMSTHELLHGFAYKNQKNISLGFEINCTIKQFKFKIKIGLFKGIDLVYN